MYCISGVASGASRLINVRGPTDLHCGRRHILPEWKSELLTLVFSQQICGCTLNSIN